jgi:NAD(P)H dehydrogenase (quinone)
MLSVTTGGSANGYSERGLNGDIQQILFPINHGILRFTGFDVLPPFLVYGASRISQEEREKHLARYRETVLSLQTLTPIAYHSLREYDENFMLRATS